MDIQLHYNIYCYEYCSEAKSDKDLGLQPQVFNHGLYPVPSEQITEFERSSSGTVAFAKELRICAKLAEARIQGKEGQTFDA